VKTSKERPSAPSSGEREGRAQREGEVGGAGNAPIGPLTLPSPPASGGEDKTSTRYSLY